MQQITPRGQQSVVRPRYHRAARDQCQTSDSAGNDDQVDVSSSVAQNQSDSELSDNSETGLSIHSDASSQEQTRQSDEEFVELDPGDEGHSAEEYGADTSTSGSSEYWTDEAAELEPDVNGNDNGVTSSGEDQIGEAGSSIQQAAASVKYRQSALALLRLRTAVRTLTLDPDLVSERETSPARSEEDGSVD